MSGGVATGAVVEQLSLYVQEKAGGTNPEQVVVKPPVSELLLDQDQPGASVLAGPDPAGWLEPDDEAGSLVVVTDGPDTGSEGRKRKRPS